LATYDSEPRIENPKNLALPAAAEVILKRMFATHQRVLVQAELGGGFSGSRVFVIHPLKDVPELPAVIKIAPRGLIKQEYQAYQEHIRDRLSGAAEIKSAPVIAREQDWGGLRYHLVGSGIFDVESLNSFCRHARLSDIQDVLERLFKRMGPLWRFSRASAQFNLGASYDRLLPVNLSLEPVTPPSGAPVHTLKPGALADRSFRRGDYVRLEGFVVSKIKRDKQVVTLNLPRLAGGPPISYRLRLHAAKMTAPWQVNDVIDSIQSVVTATRYDLLQSQVKQALGQDFVTAKRLTLPGESGVTLPNPLVVLPDILSASRDVRVAHIHGDLNLENILVDPGARDARLIDFEMSREDHVLHDLLRLETGVVTWLLPEILADAGLPPETIYDLYERLHHAGHLALPEQSPRALAKIFGMLLAVRETAREFLFDRLDWAEYYQGLTLYLLGALKFKNLDDAPQAPLPKQVAFWGAATAQELSRERRSKKQDWRPDMTEDLTRQTLGGCEIIELIGQGGMATVYRARQPRLERDVAIKVMSPALAADPTFRQRFEREARASAGLRHPNILTVYDFGETDQGQLYLVVDYVRRGTLRKQMQERAAASPQGGAMPLAEALEIAAQVADALDYAHNQGIVHRDVKPSNILLTRQGRPLLADFGLVKPIQGDLNLTEPGNIMGTPAYMSPEQAIGAAVDGRADVYALGVTLFELLTGQRPFVDASPFSVILKHINDPLPRPSELNQAIPPALDEIVAKATAKSPGERYQRARDMARALRLASSPVQPVPPTRLFISYKRNVDPDQRLATQLYESLAAQGHDVFIDNTLRSGKAWLEEIDRQIKASDLLIVLLSEASANSEMVQAEVRRAFEYRKLYGRPRTLPVRIAYEDLLPYAIDIFVNPFQYAVWKSEADDEHLLRDILDAVGDQLPERTPISVSPGDERPDADDQALSPPLPDFDPRLLAAPGGAVRLRDKFYVERQADALLKNQVVKRGTTTTIRAPRQTGKTSLLIRGIHHARQSGAKVVFLDLQRFSSDRLLSLDVFLWEFAWSICDGLGLDEGILERAWKGSTGAPNKLTRLMEKHVLPALDEQLVLAIDEADGLLKTDFYKDFFSLLRSWHNCRAWDEAWEKLNLILVISTEPYLLIDDIHQSPFNVGLRLELTDFDEAQVRDLNRRHGSPLAESDIAPFMDLLHGHPFLVRRALYVLVTQDLPWPKLLSDAPTDHGPFGDHLRHQYWIIHDKPELKEALKEIMSVGRCSDQAQVALYRLLRAGLVKGSGDACDCRCGLYRSYFEDKLF
jgi:serine/threonine protein kinase